ncbi:MAG: hypothetical protein C4K60_01330 [Ideonella sp. MAG2]|nr:MAG: hypothetical protein C4K60_01330 [Ideonella sp. MAG2]
MKTLTGLVLSGACITALAAPLTVQDGDIVFQTSRSAQSVAVQRATGSKYSHMGMVFMRGGKPYVLEAAGKVGYTPLATWTARGVGGHIVVKRLRDADRVLTPAALKKLAQQGQALVGRPYDLTFEWSDERIYCSELVWKVYQRALGVTIGEQQRIKDFKLDDPAVQQKMKERYGDKVPMNEPVVSPVAMFDSPQLVTVAQR